MTGFESFNWACLSLARGTGQWGKDGTRGLHCINISPPGLRFIIAN